MSSRYDIAISLLQGEPDAHLVLADFLEEQDDPWLAARARQFEEKAAERLGIALGVLPQLSAIRQGCNFIEHFLESRPDIYGYPASVKASIQVVRDWTTTVSAEGKAVPMRGQMESISDRAFYQPPLYQARSLVGQAYDCLFEAVMTCRRAVSVKDFASAEESYRRHCGIRAELHRLVGHLHQESSVVMALPLLELCFEEGRENLLLLREIAVSPCSREITWQTGRLVREFEKLSAANSRNLAWQK